MINAWKSIWHKYEIYNKNKTSYNKNLKDNSFSIFAAFQQPYTLIYMSVHLHFSGESHWTTNIFALYQTHLFFTSYIYYFYNRKFVKTSINVLTNVYQEKYIYIYISI